ncbi:MAG: acyl transferase [Chitinophagales bacterium]|nr:acyl transferase [Chitinophagales bacterium]
MNDFDINSIFSVTDFLFEKIALNVFRFQFENQITYRTFCLGLKRTPENVHRIEDIPFLPINFFKTQKIIAEQQQAAVVFESSGTTGTISSKHFVANTAVYIESFSKTFNQFYGKPSDYCVLALLPSYLERGNSSLVYMAEHLIKSSNHSQSGFFLNDFAALSAKLKVLESNKQKTLLLGVTYALLDFAEQFPVPLSHTTIMETGGMKGRKEELLRIEVHEILKQSFGLENIHSEYGMTELLSQAYSKGNGIFTTPKWMKILVRDVYNPLQISTQNKSGGINIIDLANIYSCSFIATEDLGILKENSSFEVLGRIDHSDVRGCSLMYVN